MSDLIKRAFDFTAALIGLIILSPVLLITAYLIRKNLGSPVLFRQVRPAKMVAHLKW